MAQIIVVQRMWQRRDTAANWTSKNPTLEFGEIGVETPTSSGAAPKFKIGDGTTPWNTLLYQGGGGGGGMTDPTTTAGDLIVRGSTAPQRLAKGTDDQVLTMVGGMPAWANPTGGGGEDATVRIAEVSTSGFLTLDLSAGKRYFYTSLLRDITQFRVSGRPGGFGVKAYLLIRQDAVGGRVLNPDTTLRRSSVSEEDLNLEPNGYSLITLTGIAGSRTEYRIEHMQPDEAGAEVWFSLPYSTFEHSVVVPEGKTLCTAYIIGAAGGGGIYSDNGGNSGAGGYTEATFSVLDGETLTVFSGVGGGGALKSSPSYGGPGGWPGGGSGSWGDSFGGGGGGYSGVFRGTTPLAIAGGGGGGSGYSTGAGAGGGLAGGNGNGSTGGTQLAGGTGAYPGSSLTGASANGGDRINLTGSDGGGGGGGYFGGGTGAGDGLSGSGGSGYIDPAATGNTYVGVNNVRPVEIPATIHDESTSGLGVGRPGVSTSGGSTIAALTGGHGHVWLKFT